MTIREPAVAGQFYPADAPQVETLLDELVRPLPELRHAKAVVVPHAGWLYSGKTAGIVFSTVVVPERVILVGPNHRSKGSPYAVFDAGRWRTPVGDVPIAGALAAELLDRCELLTSDAHAHGEEHSLEVQLPMLRRANPNVQIVPVVIGGEWPGNAGELRQIGESIAEVVREYGKPVLLVASTDLNHYEDQETSRTKDKLVLDAVVHLDADGLMQRVREVEVSMCGVAATYSVLVAARRLGARRAELLDYRTSGEVSGDFARVVGYGAVVIE